MTQEVCTTAPETAKELAEIPLDPARPPYRNTRILQACAATSVISITSVTNRCDLICVLFV